TPQGEGAISTLFLMLAAVAILKNKTRLSGLWAGLATLSNPVSIPALTFIAFSRSKRLAAYVLGLSIAICSPWIVRNWTMLGAPYFVRDNLGLELFISNNDDAQPELVKNPRLRFLHPMANKTEADLVVQLGEGPYNRRRLGDALLWIRG